MTYKMDEFTGIDPKDVTKLHEADIENTDDMLRMWADQPNRESLATKTGFDVKQLGRFASMARVARVNNVGPKHVELLMAAGIDGPKSLFEYTPETLVKKLGDVMAEKKMTMALPTAGEIGTWFMESKPALAV